LIVLGGRFFLALCYRAIKRVFCALVARCWFFKTFFFFFHNDYFEKSFCLARTGKVQRCPAQTSGNHYFATNTKLFFPSSTCKERTLALCHKCQVLWRGGWRYVIMAKRRTPKNLFLSLSLRFSLSVCLSLSLSLLYPSLSLSLSQINQYFSYFPPVVVPSEHR
jgi:hypothetical protein